MDKLLQNLLKEVSIEEQLSNRISAMDDSVWLINKLITEDVHTEDIHDNIDRNVRHLELMLSREDVKTSSYNLTSFENAITDGKAFIAVGITT